MISRFRFSLDKSFIGFQTNVNQSIHFTKKGEKSWSGIHFFRGKGCNQCKDGYKGRMGIYEVLEVTPEVGELVLKKASSEVITNKAQQQGMVPMLLDGFMKAKNGVTTLEEIVRVTKE